MYVALSFFDLGICMSCQLNIKQNVAPFKVVNILILNELNSVLTEFKHLKMFLIIVNRTKIY